MMLEQLKKVKALILMILNYATVKGKSPVPLAPAWKQHLSRFCGKGAGVSL